VNSKGPGREKGKGGKKSAQDARDPQAGMPALQKLALQKPAFPKNEIALLSPEDGSSAISMSSEPPKRFVRWQPELVSNRLPIYIPTSNRRSTLPGQHAIRFS